MKEKGSDWLRGEISKHQAWIARITSVEITAALAKRLRMGDISDFEFYRARRKFLFGMRQKTYQAVELNQRIVNLAERLTFNRNLRAYDAVQLATALEVAKQTDSTRLRFIVSDERLEVAAQAEGLQTDNPLHHPL